MNAAAPPAARTAGPPGGSRRTPAAPGRQVFVSRLAEVTIPSGTMPKYVLRRAAALGGKPAIIDAATGDIVSYAQLAGAVGSFAAGLAAVRRLLATMRMRRSRAPGRRHWLALSFGPATAPGAG